MLLSSLAIGCSSDQLGKIVPVFNIAGIETEVCPEGATAWDRLSHLRYDAALIDCKYAYGWREGLPAIRKNPSNRSSVIFAILDHTTTAAELSQFGTSFVLERDFSQDSLLRNVRAVHGFMLAHKQRQHRHRLEVPVSVSGGNLSEDDGHANSCNLSYSGMRIKSKVALPLRHRFEARFELPGEPLISSEVEVVWSDSAFHSGLRFTRMSQRSQDRLAAWLKDDRGKDSPGTAKIPIALPQHLRESASGKQLLCNAFIKQLPVEWRCSQCQWRYGIRVEASSPQYAFGAPGYVVEAFHFHSCSQSEAL